MRSTKLALSLFAAWTVLAMTANAAAATTVLVGDQAIAIENTLDDPTDLWVTPEDMTRINGFELKPEGACYEEMCMPINQNEDSRLFVQRTGQKWINVTEMARRLQQAYAVDAESNVWSFGAVPLERTPFLKSAIAPDFALKDRTGKTVHLSDFRGKKVLLKTWASW
jgi:hypothetical protein